MQNINQFQDQKYCIVKSAISTELRDFITQYALFDEMQDYSLEKGKPQVANTHSKYADPAMETVLLLIQNTIEENTGLKLFPTYSYYRVYRNDSDLKPHTDRESCEISASLCFNYSYDDTIYSYPIYIDNKKIVLEPGDMVIYRGLELVHWRNPMEVGEEDWQVQGFFHYVDAGGPYTDLKYDKRNIIGEPKGTKITNQKTYRIS